MSDFKIGDEIVRVGGISVRVPENFKSKVLEGYRYTDSYGLSNKIHDEHWKLAKPMWSIYNNKKKWSDLSDKQKGKLLLGEHSGLKFTIDNVPFDFVSFSADDFVYKAVEPVKPEPTMAEMFDGDWKECFLGDPATFNERMVDKGWKK
jgi:hypothetical protein